MSTEFIIKHAFLNMTLNLKKGAQSENVNLIYRRKVENSHITWLFLKPEPRLRTHSEAGFLTHYNVRIGSAQD